MCVCHRNEQKPIKHSEKLIYSTRGRPTVHQRNRGKKPREDFNQAAVRIVEEAAEKH